MAGIVRVGIGYDIHRLVEGRRLVLGGVEIPFARGLLGHSDGDVLLHAIADAMLGAAALPDIGQLFPDSDPAWEGADSRRLLAQVRRMVEERGFRVGNVDAAVHAEAPKLAAYKDALVASIADVLGLDRAAVGIKAKTHEGLGPIGRGEAIACTAVVGLEPAAPPPRAGSPPAPA